MRWPGGATALAVGSSSQRCGGPRERLERPVTCLGWRRATLTGQRGGWILLVLLLELLLPREELLTSFSLEIPQAAKSDPCYA